jgi:uncharacterized protein
VARNLTLLWMKDDPTGMELAEVRLTANRLTAVGVALGSQPSAYRLDYRLETSPGFFTSRLRCTCRGEGWSRAVDLSRAPGGPWRISARSSGESDLPPPGGSAAALDGAVDCDLGLSPLTNTLPIRRERLLEVGSTVELVATWVSVPDLRIFPDQQRYTVDRADDRGATIRFEAVDGSFAANILVDRDGFVLDYPGIARRL